MKRTVNIGHLFAVCDHFEQSTGKPAPSSMLKTVCGVDRKQLRELARKGRLDVYDIHDLHGRVEKGYTRPKDRSKEGAIGGQGASPPEEYTEFNP